MGKVDNQRLPVVQQQRRQQSQNPISRTFFGRRCSVVLSRIFQEFSFKCFLVLIVSVAIFLSAVFWVLPLRNGKIGFDAKNSIKLSATVQAYFTLCRPVSELVPYISRLEYDINEEIGVLSSKVVVLSMHQATVSNWTNVVFGFLSDPMNTSINPVSLSVLKLSLIELFLQQCNLTLTTPIFGKPSSFEILKFPHGITMVPERSVPIMQIPQVLFNFTLNSSIFEIKENLLELKEQLKLGLHLRPEENVYIQVTNKIGSTKDPPVTVQASVVPDLGSLQPERLKQLAETISGSDTSMNLGLDHTVFGKVKEISLSAFLNHSLCAPTPTPTPAPSLSPGQSYNAVPTLSPSYSPAFPPNIHLSPPPCPKCYASAPSDPSQTSAPRPQIDQYHLLSPISNSPAPALAATDPPSPSTSHSNQMIPYLSPRAAVQPPLRGPTQQIYTSLSLPPSKAFDHGQEETIRTGLVSPPHDLLHSSSSFAVGSLCRRIQWFHLFGTITFSLLFWIS
ncbi:Hypothetical predicted protein [Olea europaea subsp. europaea]|uniref:DUF7036 domain-containing protein n=2 Tax=Olea europaea subsp. europaea TaxID=158383 RepID=A0A8S0R1J6_OLEEU|nr:Hypothetical predicted protein [Olea europaea subsp. europaea]